MKKKIVVLMAGILFALTLGIGCGEAAVDNIAAKKTVPSETEESVLAERDQTGPAGEDAAKKGMGQEEQKENSREAAPQKEDGETEKQKALREKLGIPERISEAGIEGAAGNAVEEDGTKRIFMEDGTENVIQGNGAVQTIDAKITVPDADTFMVVLADRRIFRNQDIETLVKPFLGEGGLYRFEPEEYEQLANTARQTRARLESGDYSKEEQRQYLTEALDAAEMSLLEMQGEIRKEEVPLQMKSEEKLDSGAYIDWLKGFTDREGKTMEITMTKYALTVRSWQAAEKNICTISGEQARIAAEDWIGRMGLSGELVPGYAGMQEADLEKGKAKGHVLGYVRSLRGVPLGYDSAYGGLRFVVDDQGIEEVSYEDYVIEEEGEAVELLPFSEIRKIF